MNDAEEHTHKLGNNITWAFMTWSRLSVEPTEFAIAFNDHSMGLQYSRSSPTDIGKDYFLW